MTTTLRPTAPRGTAPPKSGLRGRPTVVLVACCFALVVVMSAVTGVNLALKGIAVDLKASGSALTWVADAYTVALAALVLPFGAVGDDFGRRRTLLIGTVVFAATSALAAICGSADQIICCRIGMGIGAAMIMPATLSTVTSVFDEAHHGRAVGIWTGFASAGAVIGLLLSGGLLEAFSWRSTFTGTAVLAAVALALIALYVPNTVSSEKPAPDFVGAAASGVAIGALVFGIIQGADSGFFRAAPIAAYVLAAAGLATFVVYELGRDRPMLDPRNFRLPGFGPGAVTLTLQFLGAFGVFYVGLQYVELILGFSPLKSAVAFLPMAAVVLPLSTISPALANRIGARAVVGAGFICMIAGFVLMTQLGVGSHYSSFLIALVVFSGGLGLSATPSTSAIVTALPPEKQGVASAMNDVTRELGSAIGIALLGSLFTGNYHSHLGGLPHGLPQVAAAAIHQSPAAGLTVAADPRLGPARAAVGHAVRLAFIHGMDYAFVAGAVVAAFGLIYTLVSLPSRPRSRLVADSRLSSRARMTMMPRQHAQAEDAA